jgi:UTP--glucose-1-phosphate uridylyltransferase
MSIKKAILPVAGLGTRFLPATKAQPKEMLPVFDTPSIQFIVEEAVKAGIKEFIVVIGGSKHSIEDHFAPNIELEMILKQRGRVEELKTVQNISNMAHFSYVRQEEPLGDGHAILCADDFIDKDESVVVLFGDDIVDNEGGKNAVQQILDVYKETLNPVVLLEKIDKAQSKKYGMVELDNDQKITNLVEKPDPADAPSDLGVVGKFILTPKLLKTLRTTMPDEGGEMRLSNAIRDFIVKGGDVRGKILEGKRFDTGDKIGFLKATLHYALKKENGAAKKALKEFLEAE